MSVLTKRCRSRLERGAYTLSIFVTLWGCAAATPVSSTRAGTASAPSSTTSTVATPFVDGTAANQSNAHAGFREADCSVPVSVHDPQWGKPDAPVTIVIFGDLESPLDSRLHPTLKRVQTTYGPTAVRLVWKHNPQASHPTARAAAHAAVTVFALNGSDAFWQFRERTLANQAALTEKNLLKWATEVGVDPQVFAVAVKLGRVSAKVDEDAKLATELGATGTPHIFINGSGGSGALSFEEFQRLIDAQLREARALLASGTPQAEMYATLTNQHRPPPAKPAPSQAPEGIEASHILVQYAGAMRSPATTTRSKDEARQRIEEVAAKAKAGADFRQLAGEYSEEPGAATRGGALGTFKKGQMVKPFEAAAFALKVGEVSGVVETDFGFHVIKRTR